jgi:hypothetical protein
MNGKFIRKICTAQLNQLISGFLLAMPFILVFSTVFIINRELANGIVTGKYFGFYGSVVGKCCERVVREQRR